MTELPDVPDMLATVRDFLARLGPTLDKGARFEAQVAVYLLDIARRELAAPPAGADTTRLCADIRSGRCDVRWDETLDVELDAAIARVRIVRPDHLEGT
ncbi:MAG TPA: hypothetical protein VG889_05445 [Rhizomicrobium sp.]|nr:hypothetical protein [Rhizomicrobium sp.]